MKITISSLLIASLLSPAIQAQTLNGQLPEAVAMDLKLSPSIQQVINSTELEAQKIKNEAIQLASFTYHLALSINLGSARALHERDNQSIVYLSGLTLSSLVSLTSIINLTAKTPAAMKAAANESIKKSIAQLELIVEQTHNLKLDLNQKRRIQIKRASALVQAGLEVTDENMRSFERFDNDTNKKIDELKKQIARQNRKFFVDLTMTGTIKAALSSIRTLAIRSVGIGANATFLYLIGYEALVKQHFVLSNEDLQKASYEVFEKLFENIDKSTVLQKALRD